MCAIAGIYFDRQVVLHSYQIQEINETLGKIFDASTERGKDYFGFYHARAIGRGNSYINRVPGTFDSKRMTDPWVTTDTRCIVANFRAAPVTELQHVGQPVQQGSMFIVHNGVIANDRELLGRRYKQVLDSAAIGVALQENWESPLSGIERLKGSMAFGAFMPGGEELLLYRDYQPLVVYYAPQWGAYLFASRDSYVPEGQFVKVGLKPYAGMRLTPRDAPWHFRNQAEAKPAFSKGVVVFSGGLDATLTAALAAKENTDLTLLHFDYGHRARARERAACEALIPELQHWYPRCRFRLETVPLDFLKDLGGSPLTDKDLAVAQEEEGAQFAHEWVPARNTLLTALAASYCDRHKIPRIYLGLNLEEAGAYPDNTIEFVDRFNEVLDCGTQERAQIRTPLAAMMKKDIVKKALDLDAPIHLSWSCYEGGKLHCGKCGSCHLRRGAFAQVGAEDPTEYES